MILLAQPLPVRLHHRLPGVALLAAHEFVAVVAVVVGGAAVLPVVGVVGDQWLYTPACEQFREGVVERLERPPAAVQECRAARSACRGAPACRAGCRHSAGRRSGSARPAGRNSGSECACRRKRRAVTVQRIEQNEHGFHGTTSTSTQAAARVISRRPVSAPQRCNAGR